MQTIHSFRQQITHIPLPRRFTFPFCYTPHPLCVEAAEEVKEFIASNRTWADELNASGKMFGVLVVGTSEGNIGYLAAFSGNLCGENHHPFFVPPVYDLLNPDGFFRMEEEQISQINRRISEMETNPTLGELKRTLHSTREEAERAITQARSELKRAKAERDRQRLSSPTLSDADKERLIRESQFQKAELRRLERRWKEEIGRIESEISRFEAETERLKTERRQRSAALQERLFEEFRMLNALGEKKDLMQIFQEAVGTLPPAGAGECALPKLLQYAYQHRLQPMAMAEFWWGASPKTEVRYHGYYYPSCKGKCEPILRHMLVGLEVDENPLLNAARKRREPETVFEDEWLVVVNKPAGLLSVPGKDSEAHSVYQYIKRKYPEATGALMVHRLDMDTSGLMVVAKTPEVHRLLQEQFERHTIQKRYIALLDESQRTDPLPDSGVVSLPLCPDPSDRPRQMVNETYGKPSVTRYRILSRSNGRLRVIFYPLTGRTHQLRVHSAHPAGLGCPIVGDVLYGTPSDRLYLHAEYLEFIHPVYQEKICLQRDPDF